MPTWPTLPNPSAVSAPEIIDPILRYESDQGYSARRSKYSRPRRRYTLTFLGKTTNELRSTRDFLGTTRFGVIPFDWVHPHAIDGVTFSNTTPIVLSYVGAHGLLTGQMLSVVTSPGGNARNGFWVVTRVNETQLSLNGSTAGGAGAGSVRVYLPNAICVFSDDTMPSPVQLSGPEWNIPPAGKVPGYWNYSVVLEEIF